MKCLKSNLDTAFPLKVYVRIAINRARNPSGISDISWLLVMKRYSMHPRIIQNAVRAMENPFLPPINRVLKQFFNVIMHPLQPLYFVVQ
jgi:hypothetical protein